jgi:hypothetical protein
MTVTEAIETSRGIVLVHTGNLFQTHHKKRNALLLAESGEKLFEWTGAGIEAATACGESIVCACLEGLVYIVQGDRVATLKLERDDIWPTAGIEFSPNIALFTGQSGKLIFVDVRAQTTRVIALKDLDVPKPGRDILAVVSIAPGRCYLIGEREMLLEYDDRQCQVHSSTRSEICFARAVRLRDELWMVATEGLVQKLACYKSGQLTYQDSPIAPLPRTPAICANGDELIVGSDQVYVGMPGNWRLVGEIGELAIIDLIPQKGDVIAVTYTGQTVRFKIS